MSKTNGKKPQKQAAADNKKPAQSKPPTSNQAAQDTASDKPKKTREVRPLRDRVNDAAQEMKKKVDALKSYLNKCSSAEARAAAAAAHIISNGLADLDKLVRAVPVSDVPDAKRELVVGDIVHLGAKDQNKDRGDLAFASDEVKKGEWEIVSIKLFDGKKDETGIAEKVAWAALVSCVDKSQKLSRNVGTLQFSRSAESQDDGDLPDDESDEDGQDDEPQPAA